MTGLRQAELGITEAIWVHSGAGKHPRPTHVKAGRDQVRYDITKGWYDPDAKQWIWPGTLVNCRCVSKPVIKGFSQLIANRLLGGSHPRRNMSSINSLMNE